MHIFLAGNLFFDQKQLSKTQIVHHPLKTVHKKISKKTYFYRLKTRWPSYWPYRGQVIDLKMAKMWPSYWPYKHIYIYIYISLSLSPPVSVSVPFSICFLAHRNRRDFCDLRLRCPSRTPEIARSPRQDKAMLHCNLRVRWKVASDLRFRAAISEPKTQIALKGGA